MRKQSLFLASKIDLIPQRVSLVDQSVVALRNRIERGDFGEVLPGEHTLTAELQIGRRTLRMALESLEKSGHLIAAAQGKRRRIAPIHIPPTKRKRRISIILNRPFEDLAPRDQTLFRKLTERFEDAEWLFRFHVLRIGTPKATAGRLKELLNLDASDLYIAFEAQTWMLEILHKAGVPVVGLKSRHCSLVPRVAYDLNGALRHAANILLRSGRRSIVVPPVHEEAPRAEAVLKKLFEEWELPFDSASVMPVFDGTREGMIKLLTKLFRRLPYPDGMILYNPLHLVTLQGWLASRGLQLPADFSVTVINHDPILDAVFPHVPHYTAPISPIVAAAHRVIDSYFKTDMLLVGDHLIAMKFAPA